MAYLQNLSDDQIAILGCCGALAISFGVMTISFHIGRLVRGEKSSDRTGVAPAATREPATVQRQESRRAA